MPFMDPRLHDQQPIARTVGTRTQAPLGAPDAGVTVKVLDLEGLLKTKDVPRLKDQADAEAIRRAIEALRRG
jgi:hypothetical protein